MPDPLSRSSQPSTPQNGEREPRRWTISGFRIVGSGASRSGILPEITPDLEEGEVVEVMPVAEHQEALAALRAELAIECGGTGIVR